MVFSNLKAPISVQYELTSMCNNTCNYCYNFWRDSREAINFDELGPAEAEKVIRGVGEAEVFDFLFTGGEPLLKKSLLFNLIPIAKKYNMSVSVNSNLRLCALDDAKKMRDMGVASIIASLPSYDARVTDAITQSPDSFKEMIRGITSVVKEGHKLAVNMVVTKRNGGQVYDTGKFLYKNFNIARFMATPISPPSRSNHYSLELDKSGILHTLDDLLRLETDFGISVDVLEPIPYCLIDNPQYHKFMLRSCTAGSTTLTIGSNGNIRPCSHASQVYGNILKDDIKTAWAKMLEWRNGELIPSDCQNCAEIVKCGGGCRVHAELKTGDLKGKDPWMENSLSEKIEKRVQVEDFNPSKEYRVSPMIRFRSEEDGKYCMSPRPGKMIVGNTNLFKLVQILVKEQKIIPREIAKKYSLDEKYLNSLLQMLQINKFIE